MAVHGQEGKLETHEIPEIQGLDEFGRRNLQTSSASVAQGGWPGQVMISESVTADGASLQTSETVDVSRDVVEIAPDAILIIDTLGRITFANHQAETIFGYTRQQLIEQPLERLIPGRFLESHRLHRERYTSTPAVRMMGARRENLVGLRADGTEFPVEISLGPMTVRGEARIMAICRDVTDRERLQRTLRDRTERLEHTFEAMTEAVYVYDRSGQILQMNAAARALAGYDSDPGLAATPRAERLPQYLPRDIQGRPLAPDEWPVTRVLRGETLPPVAPVEFRTTTPSGREIVASASGSPLRDADGQIAGAVVVTRDVTERHHLEQELASRAREIETIFETDADAVMLFGKRGEAIRMNAAQRRLLGYIGIEPVDHLSPEDREGRYTAFDAQGRPLSRDQWPTSRVLRGEVLTGAQALEIQVRTFDGRQVYLSVSGAPVKGSDGEIIGGVTSARDITEHRLAEQQRADTLRIVAHDLANPIAVVKLYLQTRQRHLELTNVPLDPNMEAEMLASMTQGLGRMQRLVDDMRAVVGLEAYELSIDARPCDLTALCRQEAESLRMVTNRNVVEDLPDRPLMINADPDRISQVLANLLSNADKYSPVDRPIHVKLILEPSSPDDLSHDDGQHKRLVASNERATWARVLVRDEGPGISPEAQTRLWERFYRVPGVQARPGAGGSLGWGLYLCREILARHGGSIGVESAPGEGSTFWFRLPLIASSAMPNPPEA